MNGPDADACWREVQSGLGLAEADRNSAALCIGVQPPLAGIAAFHCQQAVEKLMKGILVWSNRDFRRTHDLSELADEVVAARPDLERFVRATEDWTVWGIAYRYPSPGGSPEPEPTIAELRNALQLIDELASAVRALGPTRGGAEDA
jgi:HEPN domain-containing protein